MQTPNGPRGRRLAALIAATGVTVAGFMTVASPSQAAPDADGGPTIAVSSKSDRSNAVILQGQDLSGTKWIYIKNPTDVSKVVFFLDQPDLAQVHKLENAKPFDFMGTKADGNSAGLDTNTLKNGRHSIAAVTMGKGESVKVLHADFSINNGAVSPAPPTTPAPPVAEVPPTPPATDVPPVNNLPIAKLVPLTAALTGAAEVPGPGDLDGKGSVDGTLDTGNNTACYTLSVTNLDTVTAAHIHRGAAGVEGPVVAELQIPAKGSKSGAIDACNQIPADVAKRIVANPGNYYVNVHSTTFPKGAIRGQLIG